MSVEAEIYTCARCERPKKKGEHFRLWFEQLYWCKKLCRDCYQIMEQVESDKRRAAIRQSEDERPDEAQSTDEVVCPYCGYEIGDSWEYREDEDEIDCPDCDRKFAYARDFTVTYSTKRLDGERT